MLNLGWGDVDTPTSLGSTVFTVMAEVAPMKPESPRGRVADSVVKCQAAGTGRGRSPYPVWCPSSEDSP